MHQHRHLHILHVTYFCSAFWRLCAHEVHVVAYFLHIFGNYFFKTFSSICWHIFAMLCRRSLLVHICAYFVHTRAYFCIYLHILLHIILVYVDYLYLHIGAFLWYIFAKFLLISAHSCIWIGLHVSIQLARFRAALFSNQASPSVAGSLPVLYSGCLRCQGCQARLLAWARWQPWAPSAPLAPPRSSRRHSMDSEDLQTLRPDDQCESKYGKRTSGTWKSGDHVRGVRARAHARADQYERPRKRILDFRWKENSRLQPRTMLR